MSAKLVLTVIIMAITTYITGISLCLSNKVVNSSSFEDISKLYSVSCEVQHQTQTYTISIPNTEEVTQYKQSFCNYIKEIQQ